MFEKGELLNEGKTKKIYQVKGNPNLVIVENKDYITKNDDPTQTKEMRSKAKLATETTSLIFELLKSAGGPVAYQERISDTEFVALKCKMIGLEVVERRYAVGSFLLRFTSFAKHIGKNPYRFDYPRFEVFLKTTGGAVVGKDGREIGRLPNDPKTGRPIDDPFIYDPEESRWRIKHPKLSIADKASNLCTLFSGDILPEGISIQKIKGEADRTFLLIEKVLSLVYLILIDLKIEFGIGPNGELLIADVIDNDSWRLRTSDWRELSKELFRQDQSMEEIEEAYGFVAKELKRALTLIFGKIKKNT